MDSVHSSKNVVIQKDKAFLEKEQVKISDRTKLK